MASPDGRGDRYHDPALDPLFRGPEILYAGDRDLWSEGLRDRLAPDGAIYVDIGIGESTVKAVYSEERGPGMKQGIRVDGSDGSTVTDLVIEHNELSEEETNHAQISNSITCDGRHLV